MLAKILILAALILPIGCSFSKHNYNLIPPAGMQSEAQHEITRECIAEAQSFSKEPLTDEESKLIEGVETGRFSEGGRGRSISSDRRVLCYLNRNYQLLQLPVNWFSESKCETLSNYKSAGIEKDRLKYICKTRDALECSACQ